MQPTPHMPSISLVRNPIHEPGIICLTRSISFAASTARAKHHTVSLARSSPAHLYEPDRNKNKPDSQIKPCINQQSLFRLSHRKQSRREERGKKSATCRALWHKSISKSEASRTPAFPVLFSLSLFRAFSPSYQSNNR
jgi:hypothetical protein